MTIQLENLDLFKTWLKGCLVSSYDWVTDNDSLMTYVVALIRKNKTPEELRNLCLRDLEVFFNENTQKFVTELFECLEQKKYTEPYDISKENIDASTEGVAFIVDKKPDPMLKQRERSPRRRSPNRKSRSPSNRKFRSSRSRSRSRSRDRHRRKRSRSPRRRRSRSPIRRTSPQPTRDLRDTLTRKNNGVSVGLPARQRCRDFDEQGFCIQGELCPFDHGTDPVILDSTVPPPYNPMRPPVGPTMVPEYNPMDPVMRNAPSNYNNWNYQPGVPPGGQHVSHFPSRDVQQVTRNVTPVPRVNTNPGPNSQNQRQRFQRGTELEVRRIPVQQNNIGVLNQFFSKFGTVTNIQVKFQGCPESALISFSNYNEATAAYRSPEAVLGNRFIRLFWHNNTSNANSNQGVHARNVNTNAFVNNNNHHGGKQCQQTQPSHKDEIPKKMLKLNPDALKKDNQAEKTKQLINEKSNFIDKYIEEHKKLTEKLDKCTAEDQRVVLTNMIESLSKIIGDLQPEGATKGVLIPADIQSEKQLLDAELDLYRQIQEGTPAESKEINLKLTMLRRRAKTLGLIDGANTWHGKMAHKGILLAHQPKPKISPGKLQLDKRTKIVAVQAADLQMAGLCKHLSRFGKITNVEEENSSGTKHFVFSFATRKDAEAAVSRGANFKGLHLNWSWKEETNGKNTQELETKVPIVSPETLPNVPENRKSSQLRSSVTELEDDDPDEEEQSRFWRH